MVFFLLQGLDFFFVKSSSIRVLLHFSLIEKEIDHWVFLFKYLIFIFSVGSVNIDQMVVLYSPNFENEKVRTLCIIENLGIDICEGKFHFLVEAHIFLLCEFVLPCVSWSTVFDRGELNCSLN